MKTTVGLFLCTLFFAATAHSDSVLVFDLTPSKNGGIANRVYSLPDAPTSIRTLLDKFLTTGTGATISDETALFCQLHGELANADLRWITARGDVVTVFALYDTSQQQATIHFKETERKTRLAEDLTTLAKIVEKIPAARAEADMSSVHAFRTEYQLIFTRSQLAVDAAADPLKETADEKQIPATATLITGPIEHVFLSTDVPVDHVKDVKYDATGQAIGLVDTPSTYYVGLNFLTGDIFSDQRSIWGNFVIKPLLKISRQPLNSYGIAIGYRLPPLRRFGFELDTFSPFVGYIWNRQASQSTSITKGHARAGISFNLDKALGWMK